VQREPVPDKLPVVIASVTIYKGLPLSVLVLNLLYPCCSKAHSMHGTLQQYSSGTIVSHDHTAHNWCCCPSPISAPISMFSSSAAIPVTNPKRRLIPQHHPGLVPIILILLVTRWAGVSRCRDVSWISADGCPACEGVAGAVVEAHAGAAGQGDGQPFVRASSRLEGCCCAHCDREVGGV
jgi:hypothetical protein